MGQLIVSKLLLSCFTEDFYTHTHTHTHLHTHTHTQMGISEVGIRKKILGSIAEVHKKEWHMPTNALPHDRALR